MGQVKKMMSAQEAGRKGGMITLQRYGSFNFYSFLGHKSAEKRKGYMHRRAYSRSVMRPRLIVEEIE